MSVCVCWGRRAGCIAQRTDSLTISVRPFLHALCHYTDGGSGTGSGGEVTVEEVHRFIEGIFTRGRFSAECNIIALVYINRVISTTAMPLHRGNWK